MLKRIAIENYRSCLRTSLDIHPNLSVLIGPNSSGKTNILQAIMFLYKMAQEQHRLLRSSVATNNSRIKVKFELPNARVQLRASVDAYTDASNHDVISSSRQKWALENNAGARIQSDLPLEFASHWRHDKEGELRYFVYHAQLNLRTPHAKAPPPLPDWANDALMEVARYCGGIRYYSASQFTNPGICPASFEIEREPGHRTLVPLRGHAKVLHKMYTAKKEDPNDRFMRFIEIVGPKGLRLVDDITFKEVYTSSTDHTVLVGGKVEIRKKHKLLVIPNFRIGKQKLSPNQLSEGTFKTLALLFHVITQESTVLLVEEPEVCVHLGLLASILELIKSASLQKQIIISTHSDYVLDHVEPENVYRVMLDASHGTRALHIRNTMTPKEYSALRRYLREEGNLGDYWRAGGLGDRP